MRDQEPDATITATNTEKRDILTLVLDQLEQHLNHLIASHPETPPTIALLWNDGELVIHEMPELEQVSGPIAIDRQPDVRVLAASCTGTRYLTDIPADEIDTLTPEQIEDRAEHAERVITIMAMTATDRRLRALPIEQVAPHAWTLGERFAPDTHDFAPWITFDQPPPPSTIRA